MENNETNIPVAGSGAIAADDYINEPTIEALIHFHQRLHEVLMNEADEQMILPCGLDLCALPRTVQYLKILKELYTSKNAENYVVSMSLEDYKRYLEYKDFLAFKNKQS